jgi:outer membrane murein-binding lipoprotein Lpp
MNGIWKQVAVVLFTLLVGLAGGSTFSSGSSAQGEKISNMESDIQELRNDIRRFEKDLGAAMQIIVRIETKQDALLEQRRGR